MIRPDLYASTARIPVTRRMLTRRMLTRRTLAATALGGLAVAAAGCTKEGSTPGSPSGSASAGPVASASSSSTSATPAPTPTSTPTVLTSLDQVNVSGQYGKMPTVRAAWPVTMPETTSAVLVEGKGAKVASADSTVEVNYAGFNARNGKRFDDSFTTAAAVAFQLDQVVPGFAKGLVGKKVGDRVLILIPSKDGYAEGNPDIDIKPGDALVFVVDILQVSLTGPQGTPVAPRAGLPTVTDPGAGKAPTVQVGAGLTKPAELVVQPLIKGSGRALTANDIVQVNYTMVSWETGKVLAQTYATGPEAGALSGLIEGWKQGLVGQNLGSRVLLVVPPALGYPKGLPDKNVEPGDTLVFVIDLLFAQKGA